MAKAKAIEMTENNVNKVAPAEQKPANPVSNDTSEVPDTTALVPEAKAEVPPITKSPSAESAENKK